MPILKEEQVLVDLAQQDDRLGKRLGAFVVEAVKELRRGLGLTGETKASIGHLY